MYPKNGLDEATHKEIDGIIELTIPTGTEHTKNMYCVTPNEYKYICQQLDSLQLTDESVSIHANKSPSM